MKFIKRMFCALLVVIAANSSAQLTNCSMGPEGGPGVAILWGNPNNGYPPITRKPIISGTAGYAFQYNFTKIISIRTDIAYGRAGTDYTMQLSYANGPPTETITMHNKFDYMTLPVLVRAAFGRKVNFFINAGPYVGVLIREVTLFQPQFAGALLSDNTSSYKQFDVGIIEGLGISIPIGGRFAVSLEARNNTGLYNLNKKEVYFIPVNAIRNNTTNFIFSLNYKLAAENNSPKQKAHQDY